MVDLSKYTFADWMDFVFGHPVDRKNPWYADPLFLYDFDSALVLDYLITLFSDPALAYLCYTPEQVTQGLDFIVSDCGFIGVLLDEELSRTKRRDCILAVNTVFRVHQEKHPELPGLREWWCSLVRNCRFHYRGLAQHVEMIRYFERLFQSLLNRKTITDAQRSAIAAGMLELKQIAEDALVAAETSRPGRLYRRDQLKILRSIAAFEPNA